MLKDIIKPVLHTPGTAQPKGKASPACGNCGTPGHRRTTCPNEKKAAVIENTDRAVGIGKKDVPALTESEFITVKEDRKNGGSSRGIAAIYGFDYDETVKAIQAVDYDYYFEHRDKK